MNMWSSSHPVWVTMFTTQMGHYNLNKLDREQIKWCAKESAKIADKVMEAWVNLEPDK